MSFKKRLIENSGKVAMLLGLIFSLFYYCIEILLYEGKIKNYIFNEVSLGAMIFGISITLVSYFGIRRLEEGFGKKEIFEIIASAGTIIGMWTGYIKIFL